MESHQALAGVAEAVHIADAALTLWSGARKHISLAARPSKLA